MCIVKCKLLIYFIFINESRSGFLNQLHKEIDLTFQAIKMTTHIKFSQSYFNRVH